MDKPLPPKALKSRFLPVLTLKIGESVFMTGIPTSIQVSVSRWGYRVNMAFRTHTTFSQEHNSIGCFVTRIG